MASPPAWSPQLYPRTISIVFDQFHLGSRGYLASADPPWIVVAALSYGAICTPHPKSYREISHTPLALSTYKRAR
ncbi:hypothetical protein D3C72_1871020 [compost metagenome]